MNDNYLEKIYKEHLEENIISHISEKQNLSLDDAMKKYYSSSLSTKIAEGRYGIQYLDYRNLVQILFDTEPELFLE